MSNEKTGYDLLLERMEQMQKTIEDQNKRIEDVVSFNKSLLNRSVDNATGETPEQKNARYEKTLKEGLHYGK